MDIINRILLKIKPDKIIRNSKYYVIAGKHTVNQIGPVYCNAGWAEKVNQELKARYQRVLN